MRKVTLTWEVNILLINILERHRTDTGTVSKTQFRISSTKKSVRFNLTNEKRPTQAEH